MPLLQGWKNSTWLELDIRLVVADFPLILQGTRGAVKYIFTLTRAFFNTFRQEERRRERDRRDERRDRERRSSSRSPRREERERRRDRDKRKEDRY